MSSRNKRKSKKEKEELEGSAEEVVSKKPKPKKSKPERADNSDDDKLKTAKSKMLKPDFQRRIASAHHIPTFNLLRTLNTFNRVGLKSSESKVSLKEAKTRPTKAMGIMPAMNLGIEAKMAETEETPDEDLQIKKDFLEIIEKGLPKLKPETKPLVCIIGAGMAGLCAGTELKRCGFDIKILEASHRVGGRVKTIREPFAKGLHGEGGAMRLPGNHFLVHAYLRKLNLDQKLEDFEQKNKLIYLTDLGLITYDEFDAKLKNYDGKGSEQIRKMFPNLKDIEKNQTIDELWNNAVQPVVDEFLAYFDKMKRAGKSLEVAVEEAYDWLTSKYDKYSLRTFFTEVAGWSEDCVRLYDWGEPHVVLGNGFIESWKDAFLSSNSQGEEAKMRQLPDGMQQFAEAFIRTAADHGTEEFPIVSEEDIHYGALVTEAKFDAKAKKKRCNIKWSSVAGSFAMDADYVIFAVPFPALKNLKITPAFGTQKRNAISTLRYVEVTKVLLQFKTRWWEETLDKMKQGTSGGLVTDLPIRYLMFPPKSSHQNKNTKRGVIMASYTFGQDATSMGALEDKAIQKSIDNLKEIFGDKVIDENVEVGAHQVWPAAALAGGSAFAYFGPGEKSRLWESIISSDWDGYASFAGEHASWSHGWIQGAFESGLRVASEVRSHVENS
eukprot:TRINITY_DN13904_c0_g1_i1.p1 TRINITY_DN13904_c0_g1~~TRINITY_DN13904_c0_g1_i1.p1  ORF type:complete len:665 (+),score=170.53 TRINITY_DN13904_c0_g1_i1:71-2065(+)